MTIKLAEHYGLCFGVRDALQQAEQLAQHAPLTILGELAHNPIVREQLARQGVVEKRLDDFAGTTTSRVMITAHGTSDAARQAWGNSGREVADGTCPLVRHAHDQLKSLVASGYFPVVIGKHGHVEVLGLTGDFPQAFVVETRADVPQLPVHSRYGIISQTTQPLDKVLALVAEIRAARRQSEVRFCDTVCQPTKNRQRALQKLIAEVEVLVVVGGRNSNNTRELVTTARAAGRVVHHIERADELEPAWFRRAQIVGVTAGTSTLKATVATVVERLNYIAKQMPAIC